LFLKPAWPNADHSASTKCQQVDGLGRPTNPYLRSRDRGRRIRSDRLDERQSLAPDKGGSNITAYAIEISLDDGDWETVDVVDGDTLTKLLEGLAPGAYWVRVAGVNETGQGPWGLASFEVAEPDVDEPDETEVIDPPEVPGTTPGTRFKDTVGTQFETEIQWLSDHGITRGCNPPANSHF
jgi:hypothetical protein